MKIKIIYTHIFFFFLMSLSLAHATNGKIKIYVRDKNIKEVTFELEKINKKYVLHSFTPDNKQMGVLPFLGNRKRINVLNDNKLQTSNFVYLSFDLKGSIKKKSKEHFRASLPVQDQNKSEPFVYLSDLIKELFKNGSFYGAEKIYFSIESNNDNNNIVYNLTLSSKTINNLNKAFESGVLNISEWRNKRTGANRKGLSRGGQQVTAKINIIGKDKYAYKFIYANNKEVCLVGNKLEEGPKNKVVKLECDSLPPFLRYKNLKFTIDTNDIKNFKSNFSNELKKQLKKENERWDIRWVENKKEGFFPFKIVLVKPKNKENKLTSRKEIDDKKNNKLSPKEELANKRMSGKTGTKNGKSPKGQDRIQINVTLQGNKDFPQYKKLNKLSEEMKNVILKNLVLHDNTKKTDFSFYLQSNCILDFLKGIISIPKINSGYITLKDNDIFEEKSKLKIKNSKANHNNFEIRFKKTHEDKIKFKIDIKDDVDLTKLKDLKQDIKEHFVFIPPELVIVNKENISVKGKEILIGLKHIKTKFSLPFKIEDSDYFVNDNQNPYLSYDWRHKFSEINLRPKYKTFDFNCEIIGQRKLTKSEKADWLKLIEDQVVVRDFNRKENLKSPFILLSQSKINIPYILLKSSDHLRISKKKIQDTRFVLNGPVNGNGKKINLKIQLTLKKVTFIPKDERGNSINNIDLSVKYNGEEINSIPGVAASYYLIPDPQIKYTLLCIDKKSPQRFKKLTRKMSVDEITGPKDIKLTYKTVLITLDPRIEKGQEVWQHLIPNDYFVLGRNNISEKVNKMDRIKLRIVDFPYELSFSSKDTSGWEFIDGEKITLKELGKSEKHIFTLKRKTVDKKLNLNFFNLPTGKSLDIEFIPPIKSENKKITLKIKRALAETKQFKYTYTFPKVRKKERVKIRFTQIKGYDLVIDDTPTGRPQNILNYSPKNHSWKKEKFTIDFVPDVNSNYPSKFNLKFKKLPPIRTFFVDLSGDNFDRAKIYNLLIKFVNNKDEDLFLFLTNGVSTYSGKKEKSKKLLDTKLFQLQPEITNFFSDFKKMYKSYQMAGIRSNRKYEKFYLLLSDNSLKNLNRANGPILFQEMLKKLKISPQQIKIFGREGNRIKKVGNIKVYNSLNLD